MNAKQVAVKLLAVCLCVMTLTACQSKEQLKLKDEYVNLKEEKKAIEVELGEWPNLEPAQYLIEETSEELLSRVTVLFCYADNGENAAEECLTSEQKYPPVGNYVIRITEENGMVEIPVEIVDTTAPEFIDFSDELEYEAGSEEVVFESLFEAEDLSDVSISVAEDVDFNSAGEYVIEVTAEDAYGNKTLRECTVTILEKPVEVAAPSQNNKPSNGNTGTQNPAESKPAEPAPEITPTFLADYESQVLALVNQERASEGLPPLSIDADLQAAARIRAPELEKLISHTRPDGTDCFTAVAGNFWMLGENIAYGYRNPSSVMSGWMNSAGHRANILNEGYNCMGIGCYQSASGQLYWVQMFGQK